MMAGNGPMFRTWATAKTNEHGDPLDIPKRPKWEAGYVLPPEGVSINCGSCVHFRAPDGCVRVGNEGAIIYPEGVCREWAHPQALPSTPEDPNPGDEVLEASSPIADDENE